MEVERLFREHAEAGAFLDSFVTISRPSVFAPGQLVAGRYLITHRIGQGGMGEVYRAEDRELGGVVALKTILPEFVANESALRRFRQEIATSRKITHPNVCRVFDVDFHQDASNKTPVTFLTMEFLEGENLCDRLERHGRFTKEEAFPLVRQMAAGISAAHQERIIHRDLKTANVMLLSGADGIQRAVITDFGLAREVVHSGSQASLTAPHQIIGTPAYMAPEVLLGADASIASDIYAFGLIQFEMATGRRPASPQESPRALVPDLDPAWDAVILRCLHRDPTVRFSSAMDAVNALTPAAVQAARRPRTLRTVAWSIAILAGAALIVFGIRGTIHLGAPHPSVRSVAVLSFANVGGNPDWDYLADGVTESMINRLSRIRDLTVMSRSAVFQVKKTETGAIEQGRRLHVDAILTGSVRHFADHLEANVELVDCATGRHLWGEQYLQTFVDPLTFEKSAAEDTASQLRARLNPIEKQRLARDYTQNTDAYRLYLKGRYEWNKRTAKGYENAIQYFRQALDLDPVYALAYSGIADAYSVQSGSLPSAEIFPKATAAARKALELDPDLAEAHASLGFIHVQYDWLWKESEAEFRRALELNPNYPSAHSMYARLLEVLGRFPEAEAEVANAQKLDPLALGIANGVGFAFYLARDFPRAEKQFREILKLDRNRTSASYLALTQTAAGRASEAVPAYEQLLAANRSDVITMADLARAYALAGRRNDAAGLYDRLKRAAEHQPVMPTSIAGASAALGRMDDAFAELDHAYAVKSWYLIYLKVEPLFDPLRKDPRYRALLRKMNL